MSKTIKPENGRVIKAVDVEAIYSAADVIERAHLRAQAIENEARQKAEDIVTEARRNADAFMAQERQKAQDLIDDIQQNERQKAADEIALEVAGYLTKLRAEINTIDEEILHLVRGAVLKIFSSFDKTDLLEHIVRDGIRDLKEQYGLKLIVHPSQVQSAQEAVSKLSDPSGPGPVERVEADPKLRPDDCHIVGNGGLLDISIESQIDRIVASLRNSAMEAHGS